MPDAAHDLVLPAPLAAYEARTGQPETRTGVRFLRGVNTVFCSAFHRVTALNACPLPATGPAILICNHINYLDPPMIQSRANRVIRWLMVQDFYDKKHLQWIFSQVGTIPVRHDGRDALATRYAFKVLESGGVLGIFPEGGLAETTEVKPFHPGAAVIAAKSGVPVYPVGIEGTHRGKPFTRAYLTPQRSTLAFGEPILVPRKGGEGGLEGATSRFQQAVEGLRARISTHAKV